MRIQEERHEGEWWIVWWLGNLLSIDSDWINSVGIAWLFKEDGEWCFMPRITGNDSLFYNAVFFFRWNFVGRFIPAGIFGSFRWSSATDCRALFQFGFGFKLNGRFGIPFRAQSDASSAAGVTGPNFGQANGFEYGTH